MIILNILLIALASFCVRGHCYPGTIYKIPRTIYKIPGTIYKIRGTIYKSQKLFIKSQELFTAFYTDTLGLIYFQTQNIILLQNIACVLQIVPGTLQIVSGSKSQKTERPK